MTTPEGRTKDRLRQILARYPGIYTYWPVPSGYGRKTVDVLGCWRGRFFVVETKAEDKKPTLLQHQELNRVETAMGMAFWVSGPDDPRFGTITRWLDELTRTIDDDPYLTPDPVNRRTI